MSTFPHQFDILNYREQISARRGPPVAPFVFSGRVFGGAANAVLGKELQAAWRVGRVTIHGGCRLARLSRTQTLGRLLRLRPRIDSAAAFCACKSRDSLPAKAADTSAASAMAAPDFSGYRPDLVDLFALYILPTQAWYLIPSATVLVPKPKMHLTVYPTPLPPPAATTHEHDYEPFREAWGLLGKSRAEHSKR